MGDSYQLSIHRIPSIDVSCRTWCSHSACKTLFRCSHLLSLLLSSLDVLNAEKPLPKDSIVPRILPLKMDLYVTATVLPTKASDWGHYDTEKGRTLVRMEPPTKVNGDMTSWKAMRERSCQMDRPMMVHGRREELVEEDGRPTKEEQSMKEILKMMGGMAGAFKHFPPVIPMKENGSKTKYMVRTSPGRECEAIEIIRIVCFASRAWKENVYPNITSVSLQAMV